MSATLTIVLPIRIDCTDRLDNLMAVLSWVDRIGCHVIVLEADRAPQVDSIVAQYKHVSYHFVADDNKVFHRTKYINELLRMADTSIVAVWDTDVILPLSQINEAVACLSGQNATIVCPYNGTFYNLSPRQSSAFRKQLDLLSFQNEDLVSPMGRTACGGIYLVNRKRYLSLGGDNEKFVGWGPEDAERLHRVQIIGDRVRWIYSGPLYHLHHARNDWSDAGFQKSLLAMQKEFVKVCSFDQSEMWAYIHDELLPH